MEKVENFYLNVQAKLKELQAKRLLKEKRIPLKIDVHEKHKETWKLRRLCRREEKLRENINNGYHKGVDDSIRILNKVFEDFLKCLEQ